MVAKEKLNKSDSLSKGKMNIQNIIFACFIWIFFCGCGAVNKTSHENIDSETFLKYIQIGDSGISRGVTVEQTPEEGYILTGYTTGRGAGGEDVFLLKTNSKGDTIWSKTYGGKGKDNGWAVRQTGDGGYIIVGFTNSFGAGSMDVYLIKTDAKGNEIWTKTYGKEGDEFGWDIRITKDNGFIIASQTNSMGNGEIDAYLIKVDEKGNEQWSKTYGGEEIDRVFSVQQTSEGGYVAAGISYSYNRVGPNDRDGYYLKTDSKGQLEWSKTFGGDDYDVGHSIALTEDDGYIITGYGDSFANLGKRDVYFIKSDSDGNITWKKVSGRMDSERGIKGEQTRGGGYVAVGFVENTGEVYLLKLDQERALEWDKTFGEPDKRDIGYTVRETKDGGFIITGHSENFDGSEAKILLIKTDSLGIVEK